jgi:peroxiredoxin
MPQLSCSLRSDSRKLARMLAVGDQIPDVRLWASPQEQVSLRELAAEKPLLLLFYLFDWSST